MAILIQATAGLIELKKLGFVHRKLSLKNIVLNLEPLKTVIVNFFEAR
jgi:hypothetical protein